MKYVLWTENIGRDEGRIWVPVFREGDVGEEVGEILLGIIIDQSDEVPLLPLITRRTEAGYEYEVLPEYFQQILAVFEKTVDDCAKHIAAPA